MKSDRIDFYKGEEVIVNNFSKEFPRIRGQISEKQRYGFYLVIVDIDNSYRTISTDSENIERDYIRIRNEKIDKLLCI